MKGESNMKEYEQIGDNCKIWWNEGFSITNEKYTQVSGYIFNEKNELLVVKSDNTWTIPGGHPEENETYIQTLNREVMEEACTTIKHIKYLGAVEVIENNKTYYQLRYTAKVDNILPFKEEWETTQRAFVSLDNLNNYITWSNGITFSKQLDSARKIWNI